MNYKLYQAIKGNFFLKELPRSDYKMIAMIEADSLDEAYAKSQNIDSSWLGNKGVTHSPYIKECRSTSVGDIIHSIEEKQSYMVDMIGFKKVD